MRSAELSAMCLKPYMFPGSPDCKVNHKFIRGQPYSHTSFELQVSSTFRRVSTVTWGHVTNFLPDWMTRLILLGRLTTRHDYTLMKDKHGCLSTSQYVCKHSSNDRYACSTQETHRPKYSSLNWVAPRRKFAVGEQVR